MGGPVPSVHFELPRASFPGAMAGDVGVMDGSRYVLATTANVASYGAPDGMALEDADSHGTTPIATVGRVYYPVTGLGAGSVAWAVASATGRAERKSIPAPGDVLLGWAEANGDIHLHVTGLVGSFVTDIVVGNPSPNPANGGDTITVDGQHLDTATGWSLNSGESGGFNTQSPTEVTFTLPLGLGDGSHSLFIDFPEGQAGSGASSSFLINNTPHPVSVSPNNGPIVGGTAIAITGNNLQGVTSGSLGGAALTSIVVVDSQHITAVTGAHSAIGLVDLILTNPVGPETLPNAYTYRTGLEVFNWSGLWYDFAGLDPSIPHDQLSTPGVASAGNSGLGTHAIGISGDSVPKGTALSGHDTADFTTTALRVQNPLAAPDFFGSAAYTYFVLLKPRTVPTVVSPTYQSASGILGKDWLGAGVADVGAFAGHAVAGPTLYTAGPVSCPVNQWTLVMVTFDGTTIRIVTTGGGSGSASRVTSGAPVISNYVGDIFQLGNNSSNTKLDGLVAFAGVSKVLFSATDITNVRAALSALFGLSL